MQITDVESIILQHDMEDELGFAQGYYNNRTVHLIKVHTDEGVTGIGEVFGAGNFAFANQGIVNHLRHPQVRQRKPIEQRNTFRTFSARGQNVRRFAFSIAFPAARSA